MITINPRPSPRISPELLERLRVIPPAEAGHLLDFGFMDPALRPVGRKGFLVCGPAVTVRVMAVDSSIVHRAIELAQPGDVLVIDRNGDRKHAAWGEMTSLVAQQRGLAATVVDGPATDVVEIEELGYVVFSRGVSAITTRGMGISGEINVTVQCGGVPVAPGDLILADDNGVLVLPPALVPEIIDACEARVQRQIMLREALRAGQSLAELSGANEKIARAMGQV
jgi:regulator of RNase E activity RraA